MRIALPLLLALAGTSLSAHGVSEWTEPRALSPFDLMVIAALSLSGALYAIGSWKLRAAGARRRRFEPIAFGLGWMALMIAVLPPLDGLAIQLFSAHMGQHELMMLVGAPLVMAGRPLPVWVTGLPSTLKPAAVRLLQAGPTTSSWRWLTTPVVACALHGLAIWVWHLPVAYDAAVRNEAVHVVQHVSFVGTSIFFWWGLLYGRYGRAGYGAAVLYVFATAVHTGLLGAMVTFAGAPLYDVYLQPAAARGIDPLGDQQVAGLLMWVPAGLIFTALGIALFSAWIGESERRGRIPTARPLPSNKIP